MIRIMMSDYASHPTRFRSIFMLSSLDWKPQSWIQWCFTSDNYIVEITLFIQFRKVHFNKWFHCPPFISELLCQQRERCYYIGSGSISPDIVNDKLMPMSFIHAIFDLQICPPVSVAWQVSFTTTDILDRQHSVMLRWQMY